MKYFAYGSNTYSRRMLGRIPAAQILGTGTLKAHRLAWHKKGKDGSGKADAIPTGHQDDLIHGVLYEINIMDKMKLDQIEGVGKGYEVVDVLVETSDGPVEAFLYQVSSEKWVDSQRYPFDWYRDLVLAGALEHQFPQTYIDHLRMVQVAQDQDAMRTEIHRGLLPDNWCVVA